MAEEKQKMIETLTRAAAVAQSKGALTFKDASLVRSAILSLTTDDKKIEEKEAVSTLIQAVYIGQKTGVYSLDDANTIYNVIKYFEEQEKTL